MARTANREAKAELIRKRKAGTVPEEKKIYKTAIYARISVEEKLASRTSIPSQINLAKAFIGRDETLKLTEVFSDNGYSGSNFNRPGWIKLMRKVENQEIDCIIIKDLSRLGRNGLKADEFIDNLCIKGSLRLISIEDGIDSIRDQDNMSLNAALYNLSNEAYLKDISKKEALMYAMKMKKGEFISAWDKYGYIKDPQDKTKLIIDPITAPVVKLIYNWRLRGIGTYKITGILNELAIPSPGQYRAMKGIMTVNNQKDHVILWDNHALRNILRDVVYIGNLAQGKSKRQLYMGVAYKTVPEEEWIISESTHEKIIDKELFEKVQEINRISAEQYRQANKLNTDVPKDEDMFAGKIYCEECSLRMRFISYINPDKKSRRYNYQCPNAIRDKKLGCNRSMIRREELNQLVISDIKKQISIYQDIKKLMNLLSKEKENRKSEYQSSIKGLENMIQKKKILIETMYQDLRDGVISWENYTDNRNLYLKEIETIENRIANLRKISVCRAPEQLFPNWERLCRLCDSNSSITQEITDEFIDCISITRDNTVKVSLKYQEELYEGAGMVHKLIEEEILGNRGEL